MDPSRPKPFIHRLSPVDHLSPRIHAPKLLYFATNKDPETIISNIRNALSKSLDAFPILQGSVGLMPGAAQEGTLAVQAPLFTADEVLSVKDFRSKYDYEEIRRKEFPPDAVDGQLVVPDFAAKPSRVLLAQANLLKGGLLLTVGIHHCVVDETGIFNFVKLWSTYCRGADGAEIVKPEWVDRTALMTGEGTGRLEDHPEYQLRPAEKTATNPAETSGYISGPSDTTASAILFFSDESLAHLKKASSPSSNNGEGEWISTNDALCALIWSRVTVARNNVGMGDATYSMFNMTVNGRSRLEPPVPLDYTGNVVFVSKAFLPLEPLVSKSANLASIAQTVRKSILAVDSKAIKDKIKAVSAVDDIGRLCPSGYNSFQRNLGCTSWSTQPYYSLDWGETLGGKLKRVRWRRNISDGIMVIFPKIPTAEKDKLGNSGLEVYLGLQSEHLDILRNDTVLREYAEWRY